MTFAAYGQPLELTELAEPELRSGCALLEVLTCGVCYSDVKTWAGKMPFSDRLPLPHVPGHEICARVVETDPPGALDTGLTVVVYHLWPCRICDRCRAGEDNLCQAPVYWTGFASPGGFRERMVVPLDRLTPVPDSIDPVHAASLTCALGTGYRAVVTRGRVQPGSRVAIIGLGGVGIHAAQVAAAAGASVVGLDIAPRAVEATRALGLEAHLADDIDLAAYTSRGRGIFDVTVDVVGSAETIMRANALTRPGGRIVAVGYDVGSEFALPSARFVLEEVELVGSRYVRLDELACAIQLVADGRVAMVVDSVKPLLRANEAFDALRESSVVGRVVVDVAGVAGAAAEG